MADTTVETRPGRGRCAVAYSAIPAGTVLTQFSGEPFAHTLLPSQFRRRCGCCLQTLTSQGMRCSRCKQVRYCSQACQVADWPEHKHECPALASPILQALGDAEAANVLLLGRCMWARQLSVPDVVAAFDALCPGEVTEADSALANEAMKIPGLLPPKPISSTGHAPKRSPPSAATISASSTTCTPSSPPAATRTRRCSTTAACRTASSSSAGAAVGDDDQGHRSGRGALSLVCRPARADGDAPRVAAGAVRVRLRLPSLHDRRPSRPILVFRILDTLPGGTVDVEECLTAELPGADPREIGRARLLLLQAREEDDDQAELALVREGAGLLRCTSTRSTPSSPPPTVR